MAGYDFQLLAKVSHEVGQTHIPFLLRLREQMKKRRPYAGLRIVQKIPVTLLTVVQVEALLLGGADVVVSSTTSVKPQPIAVRVLRDANVAVNFDKNLPGIFDVHLDCCAELAAYQPKRGTIELTQTGSHLYQANHLPYPVISIDACRLKRLETVGTGYSFVTAFSHLTGKTLKDKKVVVFGCGKVGAGIVHALRQYTDQIIIVEKQTRVVDRLQQQGFIALQLEDISAIKQLLPTAFCIVTATGKQGFISEYFSRRDFGHAFLANMGALDEFGKHFGKGDVLFAKKPINFSLTAPTVPAFLDPILYANNRAIDLLLDGHLATGFHPFPESLADVIMAEWTELHQQHYAIND